MDINEKFDIILTQLELILAKQDEHVEQLEEIREAISDRDLPGNGYSVFEGREED